MRWRWPRKVSLPYGLSKIVLAERDRVDVAAATEATQGLPAWLMRDYVP